MCVKVCCVAQRRDGIHVLYGAYGGVLPRVDGMGFCGREVFIRVFPPELDVVVLVVQHGVGCGASTPAVAADAAMAIETRPFISRDPGFLRLATVPSILLKRRFVDGVPDVLF